MSAGTGRRYPVTMVCGIWQVAHSTVYVLIGSPLSNVCNRIDL